MAGPPCLRQKRHACQRRVLHELHRLDHGGARRGGSGGRGGIRSGRGGGLHLHGRLQRLDGRHAYVENKAAQTDLGQSVGSPGAPFRARSCLRLPRASASLGQSAAWAALTGHTGLGFSIAACPSRPSSSMPAPTCRCRPHSPARLGRRSSRRPRRGVRRASGAPRRPRTRG
eukprot:scaffold33579_cov58-Phaeocystis_antarctica.AAC.3